MSERPIPAPSTVHDFLLDIQARWSDVNDEYEAPCVCGDFTGAGERDRAIEALLVHIGREDGDGRG